MTIVFLTIGAIFMPLSIYLLIEGDPNDKWLALLLFFTSMFLLIAVAIKAWTEEREDREGKIIVDKRSVAQFKIISHTLDAILKELKKLNSQKGKGVGDARTNKSRKTDDNL